MPPAEASWQPARAEVERLQAPTETRNPRTTHIDRLPPREVVDLIAAEDATVPAAVAAVLPEVTAVVEHAVAALQAGGRVHYAGAGTSGRLGVLDALELAGTYGLEPGRFLAHVAGGEAAFRPDGEDVEDDDDAGWRDLADVGRGDLVVGLSASGRTPYVAGALRRARRAGARTALVSGNPQAPLGAEVDVHVCPQTGPEVVTGSTRMKAATAQKLVLHTVSTATLTLLGYTWSNAMVGVVATNAKLRRRALGVLLEATGCSEAVGAATLAEADGDVRLGLVALLRDIPVPLARQVLHAASGVVRRALDAPLPVPGDR
jgi:N-acetylmuramic acid 6-phosphate etherase